MRLSAARGVLFALAALALASSAAGASAPPNDAFANATDLSELPYSQPFNLGTATVESAEPMLCPSKPAGSIWFRFTPVEAMRVQVARNGSGYQPALAVFEGTSLGSLIFRACNPSSATAVSFDAVPGSTYYARIADDRPAPIDTFFQMRRVLRPTNDDIADAHPISTFPFLEAVDSRDATREPGDPAPSCLTAAHIRSLWYSLTSAKRQHFKTDTSESSGGVITAIYSGSPGNLKEVGCRNGSFGKLSFTAEAGVPYYILLANPGLAGDWVLAVEKQPMPMSISLRTGPGPQELKFGKQLRIEARLLGAHPTDVENRVMSIYSEGMDGRRKLVKSGEIDSSGHFVALVRPKKTSSYWATWAGDERHAAATSSRRMVFVRSKTLLRLRGFRSRSGSLFVFSPGVQPLAVARVLPNKSGRQVEFQLGVRLRSYWSTIDADARLSPASTAAIRVGGLRAGYLYRVRARYRTDRDNEESFSRWRLFRVG